MELTLPAARRVLDEIALPHATCVHVGQEFAHHIELVVARKDLQRLLAAGALLLFLHDLGIVLKDVCQPFAGEDLAPEVIGLEAVRVGRIAGTVIVALVKGEEPRILRP